MSKTINLLPDPVIETQKEVSTVYQGTLVSIIGLIAFVLLNLVILFFLVRATNTYDQVQDEMASVRTEINTFTAVNSNLRLMRARIQRFVRLELSNIHGHDVFAGIIEPEVEGVAVARTELTNNDIKITAQATTLETAVDFLRSIRRQEHFSSLLVNDVGYQGLDSDVSFRVTVTINTQ